MEVKVKPLWFELSERLGVDMRAEVCTTQQDQHLFRMTAGSSLGFMSLGRKCSLSEDQRNGSDQFNGLSLLFFC